MAKDDRGQSLDEAAVVCKRNVVDIFCHYICQVVARVAKLVLGCIWNWGNPFWGEWEVVGSHRWYHSKERWWFSIGFIYCDCCVASRGKNSETCSLYCQCQRLYQRYQYLVDFGRFWHGSGRDSRDDQQACGWLVDGGDGPGRMLLHSLRWIVGSLRQLLKMKVNKVNESKVYNFLLH